MFTVAYFGYVSAPKIVYAPHSFSIVATCSVRLFIVEVIISKCKRKEKVVGAELLSTKRKEKS